MITTNNRIAVSIPVRRDVSIKFKGGVPELSSTIEFCVLDVVFPSDSGYRPGQKVCLDGDFIKHKFKTYKHDGKEFTLISKEMVLGVINPPAPKLSQEEIDRIMREVDKIPPIDPITPIYPAFWYQGVPWYYYDNQWATPTHNPFEVTCVTKSSPPSQSGQFGPDGLPITQEVDTTVPTKGYRAPTALPASLVPGTGVSVEE